MEAGQSRPVSQRADGHTGRLERARRGEGRVGAVLPGVDYCGPRVVIDDSSQQKQPRRKLSQARSVRRFERKLSASGEGSRPKQGTHSRGYIQGRRAEK